LVTNKGFIALNDLNGLNLLNVSVPHNSCGVLHGLDDLRIAGATAEVARQREANILFRGVEIFVEQRL
jgi:hypothetical protein